MFTMRFRDLFGSDGVSCVKLPAAVAFPTDDRLLQRIEASRRALPANNMKALWKSRELAQAQAPSPLGEHDVDERLMIKMPVGGIEALRIRVESRPLPVQKSAVASEPPSRAQSGDLQTCVVPLARAIGSLVRARDGRSVSAA